MASAAIVAAILWAKPLPFEGEVVSAPRPIAVISFENRTGDPEYDNPDSGDRRQSSDFV